MYRPVPPPFAVTAAAAAGSNTCPLVRSPSLGQHWMIGSFVRSALSPSSTTCWQMPLRTLFGGKLAIFIRSGSFFIFSISDVGISGFTSCCTRAASAVRVGVPSAWLIRQ